jgi:hypothetical protein
MPLEQCTFQAKQVTQVSISNWKISWVLITFLSTYNVSFVNELVTKLKMRNIGNETGFFVNFNLHAFYFRSSKLIFEKTRNHLKH